MCVVPEIWQQYGLKLDIVVTSTRNIISYKWLWKDLGKKSLFIQNVDTLFDSRDFQLN